METAASRAGPTQNLARVRPKLAAIWAEVGPTWPEFGHWPEFNIGAGRLSSHAGQIWSTLLNIGTGQRLLDIQNALALWGLRLSPTIAIGLPSDCSVAAAVSLLHPGPVAPPSLASPSLPGRPEKPRRVRGLPPQSDRCRVLAWGMSWTTGEPDERGETERRLIGGLSPPICFGVTHAGCGEMQLHVFEMMVTLATMLALRIHPKIAASKRRRRFLPLRTPEPHSPQPGNPG